AERVLASARSAYGDAEPIASLPGRIQTARRDARNRAVEQLLPHAGQALAARRFDEALGALQKGLELDPQNARFRSERSRVEKTIRDEQTREEERRQRD